MNLLDRDVWSARLRVARAAIDESPILTYALPLIGLILVVYVVTMIEAASAGRAATFEALLRQEASHRSVEAQADWQAVLAAQQARFAALDERTWQAESRELASADVQSVLRAIARDRLTGSRIEMAEPARLGQSDRFLIRASLTGRAHRDRVADFLVALADQAPPLVTERLHYYPERGNSVDVQIVAVFRIGASS